MEKVRKVLAYKKKEIVVDTESGRAAKVFVLENCDIEPSAEIRAAAFALMDFSGKIGVFAEAEGDDGEPLFFVFKHEKEKDDK